MADGKNDGGIASQEADLRALSQTLLNAIAAEPVPEPILALARALAEALAERQGIERVPPAEAEHPSA
ncbi:hypothetical protein [Cereibacter changlensis]|uniref:hypothetical protein n=1 Tax=Cereibacter changlensis TaxID=402884 RepID=UPI004034397B